MITNKIGRNSKFTKTELKEQVGTRFSLALIDKEEITATEEIFVICNTCGRIFSTNRRRIANAKNCPLCGIKRRAESKTFTFGRFIEESKKIHKNHYTYFRDFYTNAKNKTLIRCNWCGFVFWQTPQHHLGGNGCKYCNIKKRTDSLRSKEEDVINKIKSNIGNNFSFIKLNEKYKNTKTHATVRCNYCNTEYSASCLVLTNREITCKNCFSNYNLAEERTKVFLYKNGIINIRSEAMFNDLVYKNNLRFDIFLPDYMTTIEIQGPHHDIPYRYSDKQSEEDINKKYKEQVEKDMLKVDWCKKHNVRLIAIPYSKVRRSSGIKTVFDGIIKTLVLTEYNLQDIEKGYQKFSLTEKLERLLI